MKKKRIHLVLGPAGYRWNFYNGILQYVLDNRDKLEVVTITGTSSGCCAARQYLAAENGSDLSREHISGSTWVTRGGMFKTDLESLTNLHLWKVSNKYRSSFVDIVGIQKSKTKVYFTAYHTKKDYVKYFDIQDYYTRDKILDLEAAACAIPGIILSPLGNKRDGYWVDTGVSATPYPLKIIKEEEYEKDIKIVCSVCNPYAEEEKGIAQFIEKHIVTPYVYKGFPRERNNPTEQTAILSVMEKNPNYVYVIPSEENNKYFQGTFKITPKKNNIRFIEGYSQMEKALKHLI